MAYVNTRSVLLDNDLMFASTSTYNTTTTATFVTKITAFDAAADDHFGISVAVGSGRIVVGANWDDDLGNNSGSAYIYDLNGTLIQKITAFDGSTIDLFGSSVAVGSSRIVVSAYGDNAVALGSGSIYLYDLNGNLIKKITAFDGAANDQFGVSVAVGSGRIVAGAPYDSDKGTSSGSAYIYDLNGNLIKKITAFDGAVYQYYGTHLSVGSGRIVVGSPYDEDLGSQTGSAYIYDLNGNLIKKITAFDGAANDRFGTRVAVGSGRIVVGVRFDDNPGTDSGSAYIYDLNGNLITKITSPDNAASDAFGGSVSVGSGRIVVGAEWDDDLASTSGSIYIYDLNGNFLQKIIAFDAASNNQFGNSVAVGSGRIVVGSINGDGVATNSGSAYIYSILDQPHILDLP